MSDALFALLVAICTASPAPCYAHGTVMQVPVYSHPHVDVEDLQKFEDEGVTVRFVTYIPEI
jgi:hypothetical protein